MKLNLFSPLPPTRSDIARLTVHMLPHLAREAEIVVWSSEPEWKLETPEGVTVRHYDLQRPPWREINQADATFYQMGNDPRYHHAIWHLSQQHPGIVILHDLMMQHFFSGLVFHDRGLNRRQYLELVERHHGIKGRVLAERHVQGLLATEELAEQCPLTAAATENALAVSFIPPRPTWRCRKMRRWFCCRSVSAWRCRNSRRRQLVMRPNLTD